MESVNSPTKFIVLGIIVILGGGGLIWNAKTRSIKYSPIDSSQPRRTTQPTAEHFDIHPDQADRKPSNKFASKFKVIGSDDRESSGAIPGRKYYKQEGNYLVLGTVDGNRKFIVDNPRETINVEKHWPISLPYGILPGSLQSTKRVYQNDKGETIEETFDTTTGELKSTILARKK